MQAIATYSFAMMVIVLAVAAVLRAWPAVGAAVLSGGTRRNHGLDGARGILAMSVLIHHMMLIVILRGDIGEATLRLHPFVNQLGSASVALFFMISAYLFGGRLIRTAGQIDSIAFLRDRVFRLVPLYLFAVYVVCLIAFARTDLAFVEDGGKVLREIGRHLLFGFVGRFAINGFDGAAGLLGPVWTLHYEWMLYACIPIMAFAYRKVGHIGALYAPLLVATVLLDGRFAFFVAGLAAAQVAAVRGRRVAVLWQVIGTVGLGALPLLFHESVGWPQAILLTPILVAIVQERRWFAFLGARPLRFLGEVSYSVYLLHLIVLFLVEGAVGIDWAVMGPIGFAGTVVGIGLAVVATATVTFLTIEQPMMLAGTRARRAEAVIRLGVTKDLSRGAPIPT